MLARASQIAVLSLATIALPGVPATASPQTVAVPATSQADLFSPAFLGMYRKVLEIDADIVKYAGRYNVDPALARAVCMFESGGNGQLTSGAGAHGYFQVMPSTFRLMRVPGNIEAGIKYLGQMIAQFGREDYALAAYNGGPGRVASGRPMPLESLQYVLGVGQYRTVLKLHEAEVRAHAARLHLTRSRPGDTWWTLSQRLNLPVIQLRLFNPFITDLTLARGPQLIAHADASLPGLIDVGPDGVVTYRSRTGDNYINLAFAFGADLEEFRTENGLWRLQVLPTGMTVRFPRVNVDGLSAYLVRDDEGLEEIARTLGVDPWQLLRDNNLWDQQVRAGMLLRVRDTPAPVAKAPAVVAASATPPPRYRVHRVTRGETLTGLADRYDVSLASIQRANGMGRRTSIKIGERLRIPVPR
jgi:LysM repeat protein